MFLKTLLLFIISINLTLPLNDKLDIIILALTILMIILTKSIVPMKEIYKKRYYALLIILFTSINLLIPKLEIHEAHSVFLTLKDLDKIKEHLPKQIFNKITNDYKNNIDIIISPVKPSTGVYRTVGLALHVASRPPFLATAVP